MKFIFKKIFLVLGYYLGFFEIIRILLSKKYVPILLYHTVLDNVDTESGKSSFFLRGLGVSKGQFEKQIRYISKRYKVIGLTEYINMRNKGMPIPNYAIITFDDGLKNPGYKILIDNHLTAAIFLIGSGEIYERHLIYLMLDKTRASNFSLKLDLPSSCTQRLGLCSEMEVSLRSPKEKSKAIAQIIKMLNSLSLEEKRNLINEIKQKLEIKEKIEPVDVFLSESDIKMLIAEGFCIGAHSVTHRSLSDLDDKELLKEVEESVHIIEQLTGEKGVPFSCPGGKYDKRVIRILKEKGCVCNLTSDDGLNGKNQDIYRLKRIYINAHTLPEFVYKVSGSEMICQFIINAWRKGIIKYLGALKKFAINLIKKADKYTYCKIGNIIREMTNPNTVRYWNKYFHKFNGFCRDFPYEFLIEYLPKDNNFSILDIGCGLGDGCQLLKTHFPLAHIEGADISPLAIQKARKWKPDINFFVLDIKINYPPSHYDFITLVHILEHFNDPFPIVDKCLKYVNKAVFIITPYVKDFESPRLYWGGEHRYLFNEKTFKRYNKCRVMNITEYIPVASYPYIIYKIEP